MPSIPQPIIWQCHYSPGAAFAERHSATLAHPALALHPTGRCRVECEAHWDAILSVEAIALKN